MELELCTDCGQPLLVLGGMKVEPAPLDGRQAVNEIIQGGRLWMVDAQGGLRLALVGEPEPLREHRCPAKAPSARLTSSRPVQPPRVPAAPSRGSTGPLRASCGPFSSTLGAQEAGPCWRCGPCPW